MRWLLSDNDFDSVCSRNEWLMEVLWDNGIISERQAAIQFVYASNGYDVPDCPFCGANDNRHYPLSASGWKCKRCAKKFSITTARYLHGSKVPLSHWWRFSYLAARVKRLNSNEVARDLEITQKSAWGMIDTLKTALKDSGVIMINGSMSFEDIWQVMRLLMIVSRETV